MKGKLAIFKPVNSKSELMEIPNSQHREEGREERKEEREERKGRREEEKRKGSESNETLLGVSLFKPYINKEKFKYFQLGPFLF